MLLKSARCFQNTSLDQRCVIPTAFLLRVSLHALRVSRYLVMLNHCFLSLLYIISCRLSLFWPNNDEELNRVWNIFPHSPIKGQFTQILYLWFNRTTRSLATSCHTGCWQICSAGSGRRLPVCACVCMRKRERERDPRVLFRVCLHMCLCFAANAAICMYLWWLLCSVLASVVSRMTHSQRDWSMQVVFSLKGQTAQTGDEPKTQGMCVCVCWRAGLLTYVYVQMSMWSLTRKCCHNMCLIIND